MVNGNYTVYEDKLPYDPCSRTSDRKYRRKANRTANELQKTLNTRHVDNETDSLKYEKKVKEPRLLRYVATTDVEENFVNDKFETYDLKATEEPPRKYAFAKRTKNPSDGSIHYAYSRSSSSCSSPSGNLPTISEHCERYGTFKARAPPSPSVSDIADGYEHKLDKYFSKPRNESKFAAKGSHPDSLYRVPAGAEDKGGTVRRTLLLLRWPIALLIVCVSLALIIYFLMPDSNETEFEFANSTYWQASAGYHGERDQRRPGTKKLNETLVNAPSSQAPVSKIFNNKPTEIDFYDSETVKYNEEEIKPQDEPKSKLPIPPIFPSHIAPQVQYGNERADTEKHRTPKLFTATESDQTSEDPLSKPHITQKPEKPLAIYFQHDNTETINVSADTSEGRLIEKDYLIYPTIPKIKDLYQVAQQTEGLLGKKSVKPDGKFTSGHSKLFGISIEDAARMQSTTPTSVYNTRVSPTLPVWRDVDDTTTNRYPVNTNADGQPQCRSTRLPLCRGVLPYDLAGTAPSPGGVEVPQLLSQLEYLVATNCSARARQFACALLEPECNAAPYPARLPCYNLCRAITDNCVGLIPRELLPLLQCSLYPRGGCVASRAPCTATELRCADDSCVSRAQVCDGRADCPDAADEASCSNCAADEFICASGGCVLRRWVCDGYSDCPGGEDETESACEGDAREARGEATGEQSAASAPAPARLPHPHPLTSRRPGDADSSELLITSDSGATYRRNYTRPRPSLSRLTPYTRHNLQNPQSTKANTTTITQNATKYSEIKANDSNSADQRNEDTLRRHQKLKDGQRKVSDDNVDMPVYKPMARLQEAIGKLERIVMNVDNMGKEPNAPVEPARGNNLKTTQKPTDKMEEFYMIESLITAHASPCPSSELRCVDGRCITLAQLCDGTIDCSDHADEDNCYT